MFKFFKKRKEEKLRLKKFEEDISGIFNDWILDSFCIKKGGYCLWICRGYDYFEDYGHKELFLKHFSPKEKKLLWKELWKELNLSKKNKRLALISQLNLK